MKYDKGRFVKKRLSKNVVPGRNACIVKNQIKKVGRYSQRQMTESFELTQDESDRELDAITASASVGLEKLVGLFLTPKRNNKTHQGENSAVINGKSHADSKGLVVHQEARKRTETAIKEKAKNTVKKQAERSAGHATASHPAGWIIVAVLVVICIAAYVAWTMSFTATTGGVLSTVNGLQNLDMTVVNNIKNKVNKDWYDTLKNTRNEYVNLGYSNNNIVVRYNYSLDSDDTDISVKIDNWNDVFAIWLVRHTDKVISENDYEDIKAIYFKMNPVVVTVENSPEATDDISLSKIFIDVANLRYTDVKTDFNLSVSECKQIYDWINPSSASGLSGFWSVLVGTTVINNEDLSGSLTSLHPTGLVGSVLEKAETMRGWIYSQQNRSRAGYADCSSFTWQCYYYAGINVGGDWATAAYQAKWCYEHNCLIDKNNLETGDLVFWTKESCSCGRWHEVHHVGIYLGNGKVIEASSSKGCVLVRNIWESNNWKISICGRPSVAS